ncbi:protein-tyrosine phosphatase-like protein [Pelagophyceae sp. CCMP2097]|nr:protein-tyrosine phosphatase-like protein [Pelagophyceae sp. CCMP2097]
MNSLKDKVRALVSKKKRRFQEDGYDLDLTYVTKRIIAMGFPASDLEGAFRNNIDDVQKFFDAHHKGHYRLYNLCSERTYPTDRFHGRFVRFPFDDHNPPPMGMFYFFCKDVQDYLAASPDNVVAIHCKAGKGRTGVMISAYLVWSNEWPSAAEAMQFYGFARTNNQKGVTIPSQRRFIEYFQRTLQPDGADTKRRPPPPRPKAQLPPTPRGGSTFIEAADADAARRLRGLDVCAADEDSSAADASSQCEADTSLAHHSEADTDDDSDTDDDCGVARAPEKHTISQHVDHLPHTLASIKGSGGAPLSFALLDAATARRAPLYAAFAGKPKFRRVHRALNDEWNRQNRIQCHGLSRGAIPPPRVLALTELRIRNGIFGRFQHEFEASFKITCCDFEYKSSEVLGLCGDKTFKTSAEVVVPVPALLLTEEVFVAFYSKDAYTGSKTKTFCFWFHCSFLDGLNLVLKKHDLDKAVKDKKCGKFSEKFAVELRFAEAPEDA